MICILQLLNESTSIQTLRAIVKFAPMLFGHIKLAGRGRTKKKIICDIEEALKNICYHCVQVVCCSVFMSMITFVVLYHQIEHFILVQNTGFMKSLERCIAEVDEPTLHGRTNILDDLCKEKNLISQGIEDICAAYLQKQSVEEPPKVDEHPLLRHIILMGDSVLDDFFWLSNNTQDIRQQILDSFPGEVRVTNLAVDEMRSIDVLDGFVPASQYVDARVAVGLKPYPVNAEGVVHPLHIVQQKILNTEINLVGEHTTVVLSIGGNDVRVPLQMGKLKFIPDVLSKLKQNTERIVRKLLGMGVNVVLVICYEPHVSWGVPREFLLNDIIRVAANNFLILSEKYKLPGYRSRANLRPVGVVSL